MADCALILLFFEYFDEYFVFQGCDLQGVKAYSGVDAEGLYTLGTVVVDYRGYRVTAQSIIPGLNYCFFVFH